jgi:hypothetical protein
VRSDGVAIVRAGDDAVELLGGRVESRVESNDDAEELDARALAAIVVESQDKP